MKGLNRHMIKRRKRRLIVCCCIVISLLFVGILAAEGLKSLTQSKVDTAKGLKIIKKAEKADAASIENKIEKLEEKDKAKKNQEKKAESEENQDRSYKSIFENAVIMGDSISEAFTDFDILNASSVVAKIGVQLDGLDDQIEKVEKISPQVIFLAYGMNDLLATRGNADEFVRQYSELLDKLQSRQPQAKVFVNSIFPVQQQEIDREPVYEKLDSYNKALNVLCDKRQIAFIDNTSLVADNFYESDGIHFKAAFYPHWLNRMAEVASL